VLHTYHFLVDHGVPAKNIITFLNYDIIVDKRFNPYPGKIYHDPLFSRDYAQGVVADYKSAETTPENILAVLTGDKNRVKGGSGRVLNR
jgi:legumain